jgi:hypothetical protein
VLLHCNSLQVPELLSLTHNKQCLFRIHYCLGETFLVNWGPVGLLISLIKVGEIFACAAMVS